MIQWIVTQRRMFFCLCLNLFFCMLILPSALEASVNGRIAGNIVELGTKAPLSGANVVIRNTYWGVTTDRQGYYLLANIPAGTYEVVVSYIGYEKVAQTAVQIEANKTTIINFELRSAVIEAEAVVVTAERLAQSQATAMNLQRNAVNIKSIVASDLMGTFPDPNGAEAMSRISGVSITRDHGEGRFAVVRGLDPRFCPTTLHNDRIPSAEDKERFIALDIIPADLIESIEVNKALTADMDANGIGGSVNLNLKEAPKDRIFRVISGYGSNAHPGKDMSFNDSRAIHRFSATAGNALAEGKFSYLFSGSYYKSFMSSDTKEYEFDFTEEEYQGRPGIQDGLENEQKRDYELYRARKGVIGNLLYKPWLGHKFYTRVFWSSFGDQEQRWRLKTRYDKERTERELKTRFEEQVMNNLTIGGEHTFKRGLLFDYHFTYTKNICDRKPDDNIKYCQKFSKATDPFYFSAADWETRKIEDRNLIGAINLAIPFFFERLHVKLISGAKICSKERFVKNETWEAEPAEGAVDWELPGGPNTKQFPDEEFRPPIQLEYSVATEPWENYTADEQVTAGYTQAELWFGNRLMLLPGIRVEHTYLDYTSEAGAPANNTYTDILPGLHLRYKITENTNLRLAGTRALNRPNYYELTPYDYTDDDERYMGNTELQPARSINLDLLVEHFATRFAGILSGGLFYKKIRNMVEIVNWKDNHITVYQPQNSGTATIKGLELGFQQQLDFIGLRNIGIVVNYIYSDSKVELETRETRPLRGHSKHLVNAAVSYEHPEIGFSGLIAFNFKGRQLEAAGAAVAHDAYETDYTRIDCKFSQKLFTGVQLTFEGRNLTNTPLHFVVKDPAGNDRTVQKEYYGKSFLTGINLEL